MSVSSPSLSGFDALGDERFVSLTTFRKTGEAVSTPVWIARDGDALVVTTPEESGKVKRIRNGGHVELRPCGRMGKVDDGAVSVTAEAIILADDPSRERITAIIRRKYGLEYRITMFIERLAAKRQKPRVILRITQP
ncbi:PPOX class F420-dependent oxidoreductase [Glaciihabitans sp. dw_435]|uniref:PPOX class F420-dependent oxidoreductase n=1 Tax=Glaciihabitans sp. dw_435 TaxID=2720081 RepID=UPI0027DD666F|nr:PPOX class F420-dependent oxidoreductase [Glaciihabitans sp. dw_435]